MPVCFRHPERETAIACTRCDRPICVECMVNAAVGFQCPECANQKSNIINVRQQSAIAALPRVTRAVIGANIAVFILNIFLGIAGAESFGMIPGMIAQGQWYRLISAAFLHGGFLHIAFNMYALYFLGPELERFFGRIRFAIIYFLAALGGGVATYYFSDVNTVSVGASGAIFGLMGASIAVGHEVRADIRQYVSLFVINVMIGFMSPGIDWRAHLGGAVAGALSAWVMLRAQRMRNASFEYVGIVAIFVALVAVTIARNNQILLMLGL